MVLLDTLIMKDQLSSINLTSIVVKLMNKGIYHVCLWFLLCMFLIFYGYIYPFFWYETNRIIMLMPRHHADLKKKATQDL